MVIERDQFRTVMAKFASGVTVVTTSSQAGYHGVTLSAFCSLSLEPPLILVCVDRNAQSYERITGSDAFVVNILARDQTFVAEQFSGQTPLADPRFSRVPHEVGQLGAPRLQGCLAWIECRPWASYDGGDHSIVVGQVEWLELGPADDPLIYFDRSFTELSWS